MKITVLPLGAYQTNCYIIFDENTKECAFVDPGAQPEELLSFIEEEKFVPKAVLLTHGHSDHIGAVEALATTYSIPVYMAKNDEKMLSSATHNLSAMAGNGFTVNVEPSLVKEGDIIDLGFISLEVLETPGHTPGGVSYYSKEGFAFVGDTLFQGSIGRTDFPEGSFDTIIESIREKLYTLPEETIVCPGHGPHSTIGTEKQTNPFTA